MTEIQRTQSTLEDIDVRQDEVLERLEALNGRVERLLSDWRPQRPVSDDASPQPEVARSRAA